jgi:Putative abortive phage resistance protein AbiGi, antitoxin
MELVVGGRCMQNTLMAYVSGELTHFVGRSLQSDDERFELLCKIISDGVLLDPGHQGRRDRIFLAGARNDITGEEDFVEYSSSPNVRHDLSARLSQNQLVQFEIVCFCDIPLADLPLHCTKYSFFGLAFSKSFLVQKGASPVMYVPSSGTFSMTLREHHVPDLMLQYEELKMGTRADLFDEIFSMHNRLGLMRYNQLEAELFSSGERDHIDRAVKDLRTMLLYQTAVEAVLFGHLKFYDPSLPADHCDNYYMEREWRVNGWVPFSLGDIQRVLVPPQYVQRMWETYPELGSCITALALG